MSQTLEGWLEALGCGEYSAALRKERFRLRHSDRLGQVDVRPIATLVEVSFIHVLQHS